MLNYSNSLTFHEGDAPPVTLRNFFDPEDGFAWSTSKWSEIIFAFVDKQVGSVKAADLVLDLDVFKAPPGLAGQNVLVYLNGIRVASYELAGRTNCFIHFNPAILKREDNVITFDTPDASSPSSFGVPDTRVLGIQLFSLQIRPATEG